MSVNSFGAKSTLSVGEDSYRDFPAGCGGGGGAAAVQFEDFVGESVAD